MKRSHTKIIAERVQCGDEWHGKKVDVNIELQAVEIAADVRLVRVLCGLNMRECVVDDMGLQCDISECEWTESVNS